MPVDSPLQRTEALSSWFEKLATRDPALHAELKERLKARATSTQGVVLEGAAGEADRARKTAIILETIVREGRPALLVKENQVTDKDPVLDGPSKELVKRLRQAKTTINRVIPLVGRIDVENYPGSATYLGTGWLVDKNVMITNRHVASLVARRDGARFVFRAGRFGDEPIAVTVDYRREAE